MIDIAFEGRGTSGLPLILVHGFPLDGRMWREQLERLGSVARVAVPDLPGFGRTPPLEADTVTMDDLASVVLQLADALCLDRFALGGLSMGGYVCFAALRRFPERIDRLILCDTRAEPDSPAGRATRREDAGRALAEGVDFYADKLRGLIMSPATLATRPDLVAEVDGWMRSATPRGVAAALRGMADRPDARPQLAEIRVPTLVICGREDRITPAAEVRAMAAAIPGARFVEVPGGHVAPLESPDETCAAMAEFLGSP